MNTAVPITWHQHLRRFHPQGFLPRDYPAVPNNMSPLCLAATYYNVLLICHPTSSQHTPSLVQLALKQKTMYFSFSSLRTEGCQAMTCSLTRSCSSRSCFPVSPPIPRSSSSSSGWLGTFPEEGPCLIKNSSCWSSSKPCSIQAESCLYITPWHTARILRTRETQWGLCIG